MNDDVLENNIHSHKLTSKILLFVFLVVFYSILSFHIISYKIYNILVQDNVILFIYCRGRRRKPTERDRYSAVAESRYCRLVPTQISNQSRRGTRQVGLSECSGAGRRLSFLYSRKCSLLSSGTERLCIGLGRRGG